MTSIAGTRPGLTAMLNKVPEVTLYFWIIKILATTVGETGRGQPERALQPRPDQPDVDDGRRCWLVALFFQFRLKRYVPGVYWLAVVLISVVGTLITDNLTDNLGVALETTTIVFSGARSQLTFAAWWAKERTLSIHSIVTGRREAFYWLAILFTFALGHGSRRPRRRACWASATSSRRSGLLA